MKTRNNVLTDFLSNKWNLLAMDVLIISLLGMLFWNNLTTAQWVMAFLLIGILQLISYLKGIARGIVLETMKRYTNKKSNRV